jgi:hypothetical protein
MNNGLQLFAGMLAGAIGLVTQAEPTAIYRVTPAAGGFQQVQLTQDIYRFSDDPYLHNLVVLDADKKPVPYRIQASHGEQHRLPDIPLVFFPVPGNASAETLRKVYAQIRVDGVQVDINSSSSGAIPGEGFYLIDISHHSVPIAELKLEWEPDPEHAYFDVEADGSWDMQQWQLLGKATLVNLGEGALVRDRLSLGTQSGLYKFLRVRVVKGAGNLQLKKFFAVQPDVQSQVPEERWRITAIPKGVEACAAAASHPKVAAWEFIRSEVTPATGAKILLGEGTYADHYRLYSRPDEQHGWELLRHGIWYNLRVGQVWETSDFISLSPNSRRLWRLELEAGNTGLNPQLELQWQPSNLQFIANDRAPFSLVIDPAADQARRDVIFNQILAGRAPEWVSTTLEDLHQQPAKPVKSFNWRAWVLWAALMLAVFVLIGFAIRLLRQVNTTMSDSPDDATK